MLLLCVILLNNDQKVQECNARNGEENIYCWAKN